MNTVQRLLCSSSGFFWCLGAVVTWGLLAARTPGDRYHWLALIVAATWVTVDGIQGAGLTQRRTVNAALGGWTMASAATLGLLAKGDLVGTPMVLGSHHAGLVAEHLLAAAAGAVLGMAAALRVSSTPPRDRESSGSQIL